MPSLLKTDFLQLNKWAGNEYPKREDFVSDNEKIDAFADDISSQMAQKAKYAVVTIISNQSIAHNTFTQIFWQNKTSFNGEDFCAIENGRLKILQKGLYHVELGVNFSANGTGMRWILSDNLSVTQIPADANFSTYLNVTGLKDYNINDLVDFRVRQHSGGALDVAITNTFIKIRQVAKL